MDERRGVDLADRGGSIVPRLKPRRRWWFRRRTSPSEEEGGGFAYSERGGVGVGIDGESGGGGNPSSRW